MKKIIACVVIMIMFGAFWGDAGAVWAGPLTPEIPSRVGGSPLEAVDGMVPPVTEPWFKIEPEKPNLAAGLSWCLNDPQYSLDYYLNEQTFAGFNVTLPPPDEGFGTINDLYGSYLFNFGLFIGMDYFSWSGSNSILTVSPGYRYNLPNKGYLAASVNFTNNNINNISDSGISGYKIEGQYYDDTMLLTGQILFPRDSQITLQVGTNFKASDELIWGVNCSTGAQFEGTTGITWAKNAWAVDAALGTSANAFYYDVNGLYKISEPFSLGLEGKSGVAGAEVTLKTKYHSKLFDVNLMYTLNPGMFYLTYKLNI